MPVPVPSPSSPGSLQLPLSNAELIRINAHLLSLSPKEILMWGIKNLPNLFQTTAFGATGLMALDMLYKLTPHPPPLIFLDTLYHFPETLELVEEVRERYSAEIHVFRPECCDTVEFFESRYGERLWETDEDTYDFLVKVEPARRAYTTLNVQSVITGRRASQGGARATLLPLEVDSTGLLKLNPFFALSFVDVQSYLDENQVPRNKLIAQGYRSVGDWHSTAKSGEGELGERAGRWMGQEKTECGLHKDYFLMKKLMKEKREAELSKKEPNDGNIYDSQGDTQARAITVSV